RERNERPLDQRPAHHLDRVRLQPRGELRRQALDRLRPHTEQLQVEPEVTVMTGLEPKMPLPRRQEIYVFRYSTSSSLALPPPRHQSVSSFLPAKAGVRTLRTPR